MTTPLILDSDESSLLWQKIDAKRSENQSKLRAQDVITPDAGTLNDENYYSRIQSIRDGNAATTAGAIAADATKKQYEAAKKAAEFSRMQAQAQQQAYNGMQGIAGGAGFGQPGMQTMQGGGAGYGATPNLGGSSAELWGAGGAQGVANVLRAAGFPESAIPTMMAIARAESSWNPKAYNGANRNGSNDAGLFQINNVHQGQSYYPKDRFDPLQSAQAAFAIWKNAGGTYRDWSVYNSGAYKQYLQAAPAVQSTPNARQPFVSNTGSNTGLRQALVSKAQTYIGLPYVWGGTNLSKGVDCSGLVQGVYAQLGIKLPRTAQEQATSAMGTKTSINNLRPGDLVAWYGGEDRGRYIGHIAVYAGNGEIIEAPDVGMTVRRRKLRNNENAFGVALRLNGD